MKPVVERALKSEIRRGPGPLPVHIGLAISEYTKAQQNGAATPQDLVQMLAGIKKYQAHPYRRMMPDLPEIWRAGQTSLLHCAADKPQAALLLIPSLINKSFILDLLPGKSFVRWLAGQGIDVYLLDWGNPVEDDGAQDMESLVLARLCPAIDAVVERTGRALHALGYCMGGTLLTAAAQYRLSKLRSAVFLASPWDFNAGDRDLAEQVKIGTVPALDRIAQDGFLPRDWIQSVFAAVNADRAMRKFSEFAVLADDDPVAQLFVAVEDWLNDGVDLPGPVARKCILDWYGANKPRQGVWKVGGKVIDPAALDLPALVVASGKDRLVPCESSLALAKRLPQVRTLQPSSGHIGMMTGRKAQQKIWEPVADWIKANA